jgi:hypothetical protein
MESIVAAIVSAVASIVVALINRERSAKQTSTVPVALIQEQKRGSRAWLFAVLGTVVWAVVASRLTNRGDLLEINFFVLIPIVSIVAAYVCSPQPLAAASGVFAIHAVNAGLMSVSRIRGFMIASASDTLLLLLAFTVNAVLAALAARWAKRGQRRSAQLAGGEVHPSSTTDQLTQLARLRTDGLLTDDEYIKAKNKLLG